MKDLPNRFELIGYLEEALPAEEMVRIEDCLRKSESWRKALQEVCEQLDFGEHSVATIWRRHRLSCPSRERLGAFLAGALHPDEEDYVRFHMDVVKCRLCKANLDDLELVIKSTGNPDEKLSSRRRRMFQTSRGLLPKR